MEQRECTYNFHDRDVFTLFEIEGTESSRAESLARKKFITTNSDS